MWLCFPYPKDLLDGEVVQYVCVSAAHWDYSRIHRSWIHYIYFLFIFKLGTGACPSRAPPSTKPIRTSWPPSWRSPRRCPGRCRNFRDKRVTSYARAATTTHARAAVWRPATIAEHRRHSNTLSTCHISFRLQECFWHLCNRPPMCPSVHFHWGWI